MIELVLFQTFYSVLAVDVSLSNIFAVLIATAYNFLVNRTVAFKSSSNLARSIVLYTLLFLVNLTITTVAITAMVNVGVNSILAKILMQACVVCWNFVLYRKVVFK